MSTTENKLARIENSIEIEKRFERANVTTVKQRLVLTEIYKQPGIGTRELTVKTRIMRQTIVTVCDKLMTAGLIEIGHVPGLGRTAKVMRFSITKKGSDLVELVEEVEPVVFVEPVVYPEPEPEPEPEPVIEPVQPVGLLAIKTDGIRLTPRSFGLMLNVVLQRRALVSSAQQATFISILESHEHGADLDYLDRVIPVKRRSIWTIITNLQSSNMVCPVSPTNGSRNAKFKATDEAREWVADQLKEACRE